MRHDITILGRTISNLALNRAMLEVVRAAVSTGIHPTSLRLHHGTASERTRWTRLAGRVGTDAMTRAVRDPKRWFLSEAELFFTHGATWALTKQWSWDEVYGSSRDDLEHIQSAFPQLGLSWRRY